MFSRPSAILAAMLALALTVFAACGGDEEEPTPTTTSTQPTTTTAATAAPKQAATTTSTGGNTGGGGGGGALAAALCSDWGGVAAQTASFSGPPTGAMAAGDLRTSMEALDRNLKTFVAQAPSEIRPDVEVLAKFYSEYAAIMVRANYDFMRLAQDPEFQRLATAASAPALQQATTNIATWVQKNCA